MGYVTTTITTCDRCGKELENYKHERKWKLYKKLFRLNDNYSTDWREKSEFILCPECHKQLREWLKLTNS